jgi:hypothetical protein
LHHIYLRKNPRNFLQNSKTGYFLGGIFFSIVRYVMSILSVMAVVVSDMINYMTPPYGGGGGGGQLEGYDLQVPRLVAGIMVYHIEI